MGSKIANTKYSFFLTYCHEIVGIAMTWLIRQHFPLSSISESQSFQKALGWLPRQHYDLVVLDTEIGDSGHILGAVEQIKAISPQTRILIFSEMDEAIYASKYFALGTNGYLDKRADVNSIILAINTILSGDMFFNGNQNEKSLSGSDEVAGVSRTRRLSKRELQIAELMIKGHSITEIGRKLDLKETTISTYKQRMFNKMNVNSLSDLIEVWKLQV